MKNDTEKSERRIFVGKNWHGRKWKTFYSGYFRYIMSR